MSKIEAMAAAAALGCGRHTITRVKSFSEARHWELDEKVNNWLAYETPAGFRLVDIKYHADEGQGLFGQYSALVIYTIPEPIEDILKGDTEEAEI
jgi:hypothetical protein